MSSLFFYLETWVLPMFVVGLIYLVCLVPTYFLIKKYKPNYWLMIGVSVLEIFLLGCIIFYAENMVKSNFFISNMFFSSILFSFLFLILLPLFYKNIFPKNKRIIKNIFLTYLIGLIGFYLYIYLILHSIFLKPIF